MLSAFFHSQEPALRQQCREWFLASRHALLSYARQQVDDMTDVELLVEDVARRVTQAIVAGRVSPEDITPYTLRSLHNAAQDWRKKNAKRLQTERRYSEEVYDASPAAPTGLGSNRSGLEDAHILACRALRNLPEDLYIVVSLRLWENWTFAAIAGKLHLSESAARRRFDKGIAMIKERLNRS